LLLAVDVDVVVVVVVEMLPRKHRGASEKNRTDCPRGHYWHQSVLDKHVFHKKGSPIFRLLYSTMTVASMLLAT
jgi:hypothetical protein